MITFTIPIRPIAQMRTRRFTRQAKNGKIFSGTYKHPEQARNEEQLMQLLADHKPSVPFDEAISLYITAYLPIPKSKPIWWKEAAAKDIVLPIGKPDVDNLVKHIVDCMTNVGYWKDDCQIIKCNSEKFYSVDPHWYIAIDNFNLVRSKKEYDEHLKEVDYG